MTTERRPCVAAAGEPDRCVAALLHGATCCADRSCVACAAERLWLVRSGYQVRRILRREFLARAHRPRRSCPVCRCAPPTASSERPSAEPLDRSHRTRGGAYFCAACGHGLSPHQRRYCDAECARTHRRVTEGFDSLAAGGPKRVHRLR